MRDDSALRLERHCSRHSFPARPAMSGYSAEDDDVEGSDGKAYYSTTSNSSDYYCAVKHKWVASRPGSIWPISLVFITFLWNRDGRKPGSCRANLYAIYCYLGESSRNWAKQRNTLQRIDHNGHHLCLETTCQRLPTAAEEEELQETLEGVLLLQYYW